MDRAKQMKTGLSAMCIASCMVLMSAGEAMAQEPDAPADAAAAEASEAKEEAPAPAEKGEEDGAQEAPSEEADDADDADAGGAQADAEEDAEGEELPVEGPLADELSEYWSVERDLEVIKRRLYEREGKFLIGVYGGVLPSEHFLTYYPVGGRIGYFFSNQLGVEVSGQYELSMNKPVTDFVEENRTQFDISQDTGDIFTWRANAVVSWRPFYGKWAMLQRKLSHFDFSFVAGVGALGLERPSPTRTSSSEEIVFDGLFGAGFHFFLLENLSMRLDWRTHIYLGPELTTEAYMDQDFFDRLNLPTEFQLGFTYML